MNSPSPGQLDSWLAGLRGRECESDPDVTLDYHEGRLIRQLILDRGRARALDLVSDAPSDEEEQAHWQAILAKARREGLFAPTKHSSSWWRRLARVGGMAPDGSHRAANQHRFAIAAAIAALGIGVVLFQAQQGTGPEEGGEAIMRGDEAAQRMVPPAGEEPGQLADRIEAVLRQYKLGYRRIVIAGGAIQIQAKVPSGSEVRAELGKIGIEVPAHGRVNVVVGAK